MQAVKLFYHCETPINLRRPKTCGRKPTHNPQRIRDTQCRICEYLFDARDIKNGTCSWCLYDMDTPHVETPIIDAKRYKLTTDDVLDILALRNQAISYAAIAKRYNVTSTTVKNITDGKTWKKVTLPYLANKQTTLEKGV